MPSLESLGSNLKPAFSGRVPTFLSDSAALVDVLREHGLTACSYSEITTTDPDLLRDVVAIPIDFTTTPPGPVIEQHFGNSAMLVVPVASFCGTEHGARYMLTLLADIDLPRCVDGVQYWLGQLETAPRLRLVGGGTDVEVVLGDEVNLMSPKGNIAIQRGEWVSIAQYLEVGLVSAPETQRPHHDMNGTFVAEGFVVAHHRLYADRIGQTAARAWNYLTDLRARNGGAPIVVEIRDSRPVSLTCGPESVLDEVLTFVDPNKREFITEFGFAAIQWPVDVDWSINSQFNEAVGGLHIGLGNGVTGAHIDLVAPKAILA
ncbi:hypothetical protein [Micromonospora cathayae]|uniref:Crocagin biosynthetic protein CgnE/B domain-containing protein n=1 Tax=Micromonospora cathayae TaxID=3028804 RepID=A0ABY7ZNT5_9ACTN|nr:hypothetical protein [Micromonospora sp. HUAS 3]WDZ83609.1 hypothetical protein PVK37_24560 [Micromonospora sp. HUAS 3]